MSAVVKFVQAFFDLHAKSKSPGIVAVSGGADSVALLRIIRELPLGPIVVAHVNHRLRGTESDEDEQFVRQLAENLGADCEILQVETRSLGGNLESTARKVRYQWFEELAQQFAAEWIATGHTQDDQAETVLHRIIRGTGIEGLRSIAAIDGKRVRPLLGVSRVDLLQYLEECNQPFRTDSSNKDPSFTRNRIRLELIPLLQSFNPDVVSALNRLATQATEAQAALDQLVTEKLLRVEKPRAGRMVILDREAILQELPFLAAALFRKIWKRECWPENQMTHRHWIRLAECQSGDYPDGVKLRRVGRVVQLGRDS